MKIMVIFGSFFTWKNLEKFWKFWVRRYTNTKYCPAQPRAMGCGLFWGLTPVATRAHASVPNHRRWFHLRQLAFTGTSNGLGLLRHLIPP